MEPNHGWVEHATKEKIKEMHELEKSIGKTGMHAMSPHLYFTSREFWVIHLIEKEVHLHLP